MCELHNLCWEVVKHIKKLRVILLIVTRDVVSDLFYMIVFTV